MPSSTRTSQFEVQTIIDALTPEECSSVDQAVAEIFRSTLTLNDNAKKELIVYWESEAAHIHEVTSALCLGITSPEDDMYVAAKDAVIQYLMWRCLASQLAETITDKEVDLNRRPGETKQEHQQRITAYLNE